MEITLAELAQRLNAKFEGDDACIITGIAPLDTAEIGQIAFLANPQYRKLLATTRASAVILSPSDRNFCPVPVLVLDNPYLGYAQAAQLFAKPPSIHKGIHPTASIGAHTHIHPDAHIGPYCVIGDGVHIGAESLLYPYVSVYHEVQIGERVIIQSGAVIGSDGFGFAPDAKGRWIKIPQLGRVIIGNDVEIGANTTIDRGALGDTVIEEGVKLDNQIQIGHNVHIGAHTIVAGCTGIAGSAFIGRHCRIGGAACINGHIRIADGTVITGMSMVTHSISEAGIYSSGTGLQDNRTWQKNMARLRQLDKMARRLTNLEKRDLEK
jgi:UDP-3-O-[3-hydroxymyristoyl] glucosamine N-acyltransferase